MADDWIHHECHCNEEDPPYHIVNTLTGEYCGPFSTYLDASRALSINNAPGWFNGEIIGLEMYLERTAESRNAALAAHAARMKEGC